MKIKTQDLYLSALDWAVAQCEGLKGDVLNAVKSGELSPSTQWHYGGPIIERERIGLWAYQWNEQGEPEAGWYAEDEGGDHVRTGVTPLIAAMRCYVASKLGDEVDVPDELTQS